MIWVDFSIIGLITMALVAGALKGYRHQSFSLICWLVAILVGMFFSRDFSVLLKPSVTDFTARLAAAFAVLCMITLTIGSLVRLLLGQRGNSAVGIISRLGGMLFGIAHGIIFVTIIVLLAGLSPLPSSPWWQDSKFLPPFQTGAIWLRDHVPSDMSPYINYRQ